MQHHFLSFQDEARGYLVCDSLAWIPRVWTTSLHIKSSLLSQSQGEAENSSYPTHQYLSLFMWAFRAQKADLQQCLCWGFWTSSSKFDLLQDEFLHWSATRSLFLKILFTSSSMDSRILALFFAKFIITSLSQSQSQQGQKLLLYFSNNSHSFKEKVLF